MILEVGPLVAEGRLATVHRGTLGGRAVAVKRARAQPAGAAAALRREARVLNAARHPSLVPVLDVLDDPLVPAVVLGWADGGSVSDLLADGPLPPADLVHILRPVAEALEELHRAGEAHLDVTTDNVLLAAGGPLLIDPAPPGAGTPGYADPAVAGGGPASARSDVFGLAACAHVALTGRLPRRAGGVAVGLALPGPLAGALAAGLHPDPGRRPHSPCTFVDRLEEALGVACTRHRPQSSGGLPPRGAAPRPGGARLSRTWPFDRWHDEAAAAAARRAIDTRLLAPPPPEPDDRP